MVPKKDGGFRLVVDLRHINAHTTKISTKFETLRSFLPNLRPQQFLVAWDIRDAFHHLHIEPKSVGYFQFQINDQLFEAPGLTFGWTNSPPVFTKLMRPVVAFLRAPQSAAPRRPRHPALAAYWAANPDPSLSPYMDDFAGGLRGRSATRKWGTRVQAILAALGIVLKPSKCTWTPTQVLPHLGVILDTHRELVIAPPAKVEAIRGAASDLLAHGRRPIPARVLARFCGRGQSL
jgi:hypothetical protein